MKISLFRIALKNIGRKRFRSLSVVVAGAMACCLVLVGTITVKSVRNGLKGGMDRLGADILVVPQGYESNGSKVLLGGESSSFYMSDKILAKVASIQGVEKSSPQLYITSATLECCSMPTIQLVGFDPKTDFVISPWMAFKKQSNSKGVAVMTIGANTMYASDEAYISFFGKRFQIKSATMKTGIRFIDYSAFMSMDVARDMINMSHTNSGASLTIEKDQISSVAVKIGLNVNVEDVAQRIEASIPGVRSIVSQNLVSSFKQDVRGILAGIVAAGALSWGMTVLLMGIVFTMIVNERRKELGLLRAMGANRGHLVKMIVMEAGILSCLGAVLGIGGGLLLLGRVEDILAISAGSGGVPFVLPPQLYIMVAAVVCFSAILLSGTATAIYPARQVGKVEPYEAIRKG